MRILVNNFTSSEHLIVNFSLHGMIDQLVKIHEILKEATESGSFLAPSRNQAKRTFFRHHHH